MSRLFVSTSMLVRYQRVSERARRQNIERRLRNSPRNDSPTIKRFSVRSMGPAHSCVTIRVQPSSFRDGLSRLLLEFVGIGGEVWKLSSRCTFDENVTLILRVVGSTSWREVVFVHDERLSSRGETRGERSGGGDQSSLERDESQDDDNFSSA